MLERRHYQDRLSIDRTELLALIRGGEDSYVELKVRLSNPETIAAEAVAMANSGGGFIIFGVNDQRRVEGVDDPEYLEEQLVEICQTDVRPPLRPLIDKIGFDNGRRVVALEIVGNHPPYYSSDRRCYVRMGSIKREATLDEIREMYDPRRSVGFESIPILDATIEDIDDALLWSYARDLRAGALADFEARGYPVGELLQRHLELANEFQHRLVPTLAGVLLFGKNDRVAELFPRSGLVAIRFAGNSNEDPEVERMDPRGNLASVYEQTLQFIRRYSTLSDESRPPKGAYGSNAPVAARPSFPRAAILEALCNAVLHRDYSLRDGVTRLEILDDRIEIHNPFRGNGLRLEPYYFGVVNVPYPRIKSTFKSRGYGLETVEGGIPALINTAQTFSGTRPEIRLSSEEFHIKVYGVR